MWRKGAYAALMVDMKKSRSYLPWERELIQYYIVDVLKVLNEIFREELVREMAFSAGDEVQGLFGSQESAYQYFRIFELFLHPVKLRAGIGVGDWEVRMMGQGSTSQDGSTYHHARYAIEHAQDGEENGILLYSGSERDCVINALIGHLSVIAQRRSIHQNQLTLLTEWMFPLLERGKSELFSEKYLEAEEILKRKSGFDHEIGRVNKFLPFDRLNWGALQDTGVVFLREERQKDTFYISRGKQRGIPTQLSNVLGMNRQSVEKTLRAGDVFSARNMALAALKEMREIG